jgi:hypothetical protein
MSTVSYYAKWTMSGTNATDEVCCSSQKLVKTSKASHARIFGQRILLIAAWNHLAFALTNQVSCSTLSQGDISQRKLFAKTVQMTVVGNRSLELEEERLKEAAMASPPDPFAMAVSVWFFLSEILLGEPGFFCVQVASVDLCCVDHDQETIQGA